MDDSIPIVGVAVDTKYAYGRQVLRGALRYANATRRWQIVREFDLTHFNPATWRGCAGVIVTAAGEPLEILRRHCPRVVSCSGFADPQPGLGVVCMDGYAIGRLAAEHLLDCRLRHFAYYGFTETEVSEARQRGFLDVLQAKGFRYVTSPVHYAAELHENPANAGSRRPALIAWLRSLPAQTGVFAFDDMAASDLAAACQQANLAVPDHIAILGVNNDDLLCESTWPPLSSIDCDFSRVGYAAARLLQRMLDGEKIPEGERKIELPPVGVVSRTSTDLLAVEDPDLALAVRFIREHACDPCSVYDILRHVPVSRRWLEKLFVEKLGRTPNEEILHVRMETASRLLALPDITQEEIARRCGYSDVSSFGRAFSKVTGESPGVFRRRRVHS